MLYVCTLGFNQEKVLLKKKLHKQEFISPVTKSFGDVAFEGHTLLTHSIVWYGIALRRLL